ncbi:exodeoxyribonuclease VII large subunit [Bisgaard Taxon 10/6]|uniref:exodeoxyribonuclease VII large subunit n=1 Tax=Exercitatus varius TaxID=67857 RepID=UPI00294B7794|nr:exodeoxyribonuclease VII large subunit [Exercitatus varius]MDG2948466.1 exodeoxyribonuclease VII large subunit [Exercitatus varius]
MNNANIYSVSQLNHAAKMLLEGQLGLVWLTGEISNFSQPASGHWYLTLKDENSQVRAAMFRMKNMRVGFRPQNGMQVLVRAAVSLYEPRGDYQLIIESMHPAGEGLLQQQFEQLKMKLAAEGLFAQNLKKNLPHFCKTVGVITSPTGAALQDILHILKRRDPNLNVVIYPTAVQGKEAASEIVEMINLANIRCETDVLIVGRGGGSLEDLWCFNEEAVARAIFHSALPVISAVGHETDVTIADFVADVRAPTPSAAAELVSRNQDELLQQLNYKRQRLDMALDRIISLQHQRLQRLILRLQNRHPQNRLHMQSQHTAQLARRLTTAMARLMEKNREKLTALSVRLHQNPLPYQLQKQRQYMEQLHARLNFAVKNNLSERQHKLANLCGKLDGLSPLKVLARGYSIAQNRQGVAVTSVSQVRLDEPLQTQVADGFIESRITKIKEKPR